VGNWECHRSTPLQHVSIDLVLCNGRFLLQIVRAFMGKYMVTALSNLCLLFVIDLKEFV